MKTETETTEMGINGHPIDSGMAWWRSSRARQGFRNGLALVLLVTAPGIAIATQLNLATSPLFLTLNSKPNIVFLADDFASMDWAMVTTESDGVMTAGSCTYYYTHPTPTSGTGATPPAKKQFRRRHGRPGRMDCADRRVRYRHVRRDEPRSVACLEQGL